MKLFFVLGHENIVKLLLQNGAKVNEKNTDLDMPLYFAAKHGNFQQ